MLTIASVSVKLIVQKIHCVLHSLNGKENLDDWKPYEVQWKWFSIIIMHIEYTCAMWNVQYALNTESTSVGKSYRFHENTLYTIFIKSYTLSIYESRNLVFPNEMHKRQIDHCTNGFTFTNWKPKTQTKHISIERGQFRNAETAFEWVFQPPTK